MKRFVALLLTGLFLVPSVLLAGDFDAAIEAEYEKAYDDAMEVFEETGSRKKAREAYQKNLTDLVAKFEEEKLTIGHRYLGEAYLRLNRMEDAVASLEKFLEVAPESDMVPDVRQNLAHAYLRLQKATKAKEQLVTLADYYVEQATPGDDVDSRALEEAKAAYAKVKTGASDLKAELKGLPEGADARQISQAASGFKRVAVNLDQARLIGHPAPAIPVEATLQSGEKKTLADYQGDVVLLDFWATWCPPCRKIMPELFELYNSKKDEGFTILGITQYYGMIWFKGKRQQGLDKKAEQEKLDEFLKKQFDQPVPYPVWLANEEASKAYSIAFIPTVVIVDKRGIIRKIGHDDETETFVDELLKEEGPGESSE